MCFEGGFIVRDLLKMFFFEHLDLPERVEEFCSTLPGYSQAKQEYDAVTKQMAQVSGFELYDRFERALFRYTEYEVRAYYLFGLGLRRELMDAMERAL